LEVFMLVAYAASVENVFGARDAEHHYPGFVSSNFHFCRRTVVDLLSPNELVSLETKDW
jgi:hypothetical protein